MAKRYESVKSGEWVQPVRRGYKMACCDCGLVHTLNFRLAKDGRGSFIQFQAFRNDAETEKLRRKSSKAC